MSQFLQDFRAQYPDYDDVSDDVLVGGLHAKYQQEIAPQMTLDEFKTSIGYQPFQQPQPLATTPDIAGQAPQPVEQTQVPQAPQKRSMLDRVNEKLLNMGAGALERAGDIAGATLQATQTLTQPLDQKFNTGMIGFEENSMLPTYFSAGEVERRRIPNYSQQASESMQGANFGYREQESWDDVKNTYQNEGISPALAASVAEYGIEQGVKSIPDMAAVLTSLPLYVLTRSQEIGTARAQNSGRDVATAEDVARAAPFALSSAMLERMGVEGITTELAQKAGQELMQAGLASAAARVAASGGKALSKEAITEAIQEGIVDYAGERYGTDAAMSLAEASDRALAGAVAGGVFGGAAGTVAGTVRETNLAAQRSRLDAPQQFRVDSEGPQGQITQPSKATVQAVGALAPVIDQARFGSTEQQALDAFNPANAQIQQNSELSQSVQAAQPDMQIQQENKLGDLPGNVDVQFEPTIEQKVSDREIVEAPVSELTLSRDIPQFKSGANAKGVVDQLGGTFDRTGVGPIQVWIRQDGRKEVISGRHRLDLAQRSGERTIPAQYHYESEGFDRDQAVMLDALLNIREGQGKVKDYVEFIKGTELTKAEADAQGILARQTGRRAYTVATQGSDALIAAHRNDDISDEAAERIANASPNNEGLQALGLQALKRNKSISYAENLMQALSTFEQPQEQQGDLFGFDDSVMKEAAKMAEIAAARQQELQKSLSAIRGAAKNPELARAQGVDVKNPDAVKTRIDQLSQDKKALDNWATNAELTRQIRAEAQGVTSQEPVKSATPEIKTNTDVQDSAKPTFRELNAAINAKKARIKEIDDFFDTQKYGTDYTLDEAERLQAERRKIEFEDLKELDRKYSDLGYENEKMPEKVASGVGVINTRPIKGTLYRETSPQGLKLLLSGLFSKGNDNGFVERLFVADDKDLALGQDSNTGVMIEFDGDYVSGEEHRKPFTGVAGITGKEFKTDYIHRNAIKNFTLPDDTALTGPAQVFADRYFDKTESGDGFTTYTRKGSRQKSDQEPVKSATPEKTVAAEKSAPQKETPVKENSSGKIKIIDPDEDVVDYDLRHTSDELIQSNKPNDVFGDYIWFSSGKEYSLQSGHRKYVYGLNSDHFNFLDVDAVWDDHKPDRKSAAVQNVMNDFGVSFSEAQDILDGSETLDGEDGWKQQRYQSELASELGYDGMKTRDEQGTAYSLDLKKNLDRLTLVGKRDFAGNELSLDDERVAGQDSASLSVTPAPANKPQNKIDENVESQIREKGKASLTSKQLNSFDQQVLESVPEKDRAPIQKALDQKIAYKTTKTTHGKKKQDLWVVSIDNRLDRKLYDELLGKAKEFGGYYSTYTKNGAVAGFQFESKSSADSFTDALKDQNITASDFAEAKADIKKAQAAEKLLKNRKNANLVTSMLTVLEASPGETVFAPASQSNGVAEVLSSLVPDVKLAGGKLSDADVLSHTKKYDRIILKPQHKPVDQIMHGYELLKPNGTLVATVDKSTRLSKDFRQWFKNNGGLIQELPEYLLMSISKPDTRTLNMKPPTQEQFNSGDVYNQGNNYLGLYGTLGLPPRYETFIIDGAVHQMPKTVQRHEPILQSMIDIAGRRIYYSKVRGKSRLGFYNSRTGELRTSKANDVEVWAHELAHYLDFYSNTTLPDFQRLYKDDRYAREVMSLSYTSDTRALQQLEGFAEFVRHWLTNSYEAQTRAPEFYRAFDTLLKRDQKLYKKMKKMQLQMHRYYLQGPDKLGQAKFGLQKTVMQRISEAAIRRHSRLRQELIDRNHALRRMQQDLTGVIGEFDSSAWKQMRVANGGYESIADSMLNYGTMNFNERGDLEKTGKGLHEILNPVEKIRLRPEDKNEQPIELLMRYFVGRRATELARQGRENLIPAQSAAEWLKLADAYPIFKSIFREYQGFNERMLDFYVSSGLLSEEQKAKFREINKDYVPFFRVREALESVNAGRSASGFKRLKGGTQNLDDILVNITEGLESNVRAALQNRAKATLYAYADNSRDGALWAVKIPADSAPVLVHKAQMISKLKKVFEAMQLNFDEYFATETDFDMSGDTEPTQAQLNVLDKELLTFWQMGVRPTLKNGNGLDFYLDQGKPVYYEVRDPLLHESLLAMNPHNYGSFMRAMFAVKNGFTRSITLGVEFVGANLVRDTLGAAVMSKGQFKPFVDSFKGMYSFITQDQYYKEFMQHGGGYSSRLETLGNERNARRRVRLKNYGPLSVWERFFSAFDHFASVFEYGTRIGEFRIAKKQGESSFDAAFRGREISTDFSVTGASVWWTGFVRTVPFFNAMVQSQDRVYREAFIKKKYDGNPARIAMKAVLGIALPSFLLWWMNQDDDEYKKIPEAEKRTNWHIKMGDRFVKIPKPFDVGFVYGTMPELFFQYMKDREGRKMAEGFVWTLAQMYGVDGVPALATGWWDLVRNKDWTDRAVVPASLLKLSPENQYNSTTNELFVQFGDYAGISPLKAEHFFRAYTGYFGGYMLALTERMMWDDERFGPIPEKDFSQNPFLKRFITPEVRSYTGDMERFFELKEMSDRVVADVRKGVSARTLAKNKNVDLQSVYEDDPFYGYSKQEKQVLEALNKSMNKVTDLVYDMDGINTQEIVIRYKKELTATQKREQLENMWRQKTDLFRKYVEMTEQELKKARALTQ